MNHTDDLFIPLNNRLEEEDFEDVSGLDAALDVLTVGGKADEHPERRMKVSSGAYSVVLLVVM
ncbi:DUF1014 domain-containing protein [archaeon]|nr:MAG: DUF1014 domain-containing protein [archaeon]